LPRPTGAAGCAASRPRPSRSRPQAQHSCPPRGRLHGALTCAAQGEGAEWLGLDGSSSLLADEAGLPPGIARSVERGGGAALRARVAAHMVSEAVDCVTLARLLDEHGVQKVPFRFSSWRGAG